MKSSLGIGKESTLSVKPTIYSLCSRAHNTLKASIHNANDYLILSLVLSKSFSIFFFKALGRVEGFLLRPIALMLFTCFVVFFNILYMDV